MEQNIQLLLGPFGALVLLLIIGKYGFTFLTKLIEKQDLVSEKRANMFDSLHNSTLKHIHAQTEAVRSLSESVTTLATKINSCPVRLKNYVEKETQTNN